MKFKFLPLSFSSSLSRESVSHTREIRGIDWEPEISCWCNLFDKNTFFGILIQSKKEIENMRKSLKTIRV